MTTRHWMIAVAFIAVGLYRVELGVLLAVAALAFVAVHSLVVAPGGTRPRRLAISYLVTLAWLYLPYAWLVVLDYPWNDYHWLWITMWPVLPGFTVGMFVHPNETAMRYAMAVGTALLIALFTWLGSLGRKSLIATSTVVLIGSGIQSWFSYAIFLF